MALFKPRNDGDIMSLELLSIAFGPNASCFLICPSLNVFQYVAGLCTFEKQLRGRNVEIFSDNTGAERATDKGGSREWDHSCITHCIWFVCIQCLVSYMYAQDCVCAGHAFLKWVLDYGFPESPARTTSRTTRLGMYESCLKLQECSMQSLLISGRSTT